MAASFVSSLFRKKVFDSSSLLQSKLKRCLTVVDVTALAVGQMIGAGIYVLAGSVIHNQAGPSIIISFLFAGLAALLSAFSYAEFGALFPRAGSAYTYAYVGAGEVWAFIIGWNVILEYMIGNAAIARSWSAYFDNLIGNYVQNITVSTIGHLSSGGGFFSSYPDILAFLVVIIASVIIAFGSKASATLNKFFVVLNLAVIVFVAAVGFANADFSNWIGENEQGVSKFFPFGFAGTLSGAATVFFSFIGFEALATAGEEAKNPRRTIPLATFFSLALVTSVYILMAASLTVMLPYDKINPNAAFSEAFQAKGLIWAKYIVAVGALIGMANNQMTGAFALPRAVYAMAEDGLLFSFLASVNKRTKVPLNAIICSTILNGILALIFDLEALVEFLSIGTLLAYSFVSASVILRRYQPAGDPISNEPDEGGSLEDWVPHKDFFSSLPEGITIIVSVVTFIIGVFMFAICFRIGLHHSLLGYIPIVIGGFIMFCGFVSIFGHKQNSLDLSFKVPFVPFIPALSLTVNIFMMVYLNAFTWIRLVIWIAIGLLIYAVYGYGHSKEGIRRRAVQDVEPTNNITKFSISL